MCLAGSLTALVCQHSIMPLALPCKLIIPDRGERSTPITTARWQTCLIVGTQMNRRAPRGIPLHSIKSTHERHGPAAKAGFPKSLVYELCRFKMFNLS